MTKVFLDANTFIDIIENRDPLLLKSLDKHVLYVSTSTLEIWSYLYKLKISDIEVRDITANYNLVGVTAETTLKALVGPTTDLEDNIQLHSAVEVGAGLFLTKDKALLKQGYFGKMRVAVSL